jgi:hypothetical protein
MRTEDKIKDVLISDDQPLSELSDEALQVMAEAGAEVLNIHRVLAKTGANVVGELLKTQEGFFEWDHLPKGDVYDRETHAQYYYHAHAADQRFKGEHGHFHTFLRPKGMPADVKPAAIPGATLPEDKNNHLSHLVAVSMNPPGFAFRLFTVNRWVTGEVWYKANQVKRMLDLFVIDHTWPSWPVNRWISAMIPLFKPQILALIEARDRTIERWVAEVSDSDTPHETVFEDREREVTSYLYIDVERQVKAIEAEIRRRDS